MKKLHFFCTAAGLLLSVYARAYRIEGYVPDVPDGTRVSLNVINFRDIHPFSRAAVSNGYFIFEGENLPNDLQLMCLSGPEGGIIPFWLSSGTQMKISGNGSSSWTIESDEPEQKLFEYILSLEEITEMKPGLPIEDMERIRDSSAREFYARFWPVMEEHPNSGAALYILNLSMMSGVAPRADVEKAYERLDPASRERWWGENLREMLERPAGIREGDLFADFVLTDPEEYPQRLSDYLGKERYILLDFWSTGCAFCRAAFPEMQEVAARYAGRLQIVGINNDLKKETWLDTSQKENLPWLNLWDAAAPADTSSVSSLYGVSMQPTYVLIAPDGRVVKKWAGYRSGTFEKEVAQVLEGKE